MKAIYERPDAEIVNLATLACIALLDERREAKTSDNNDVHDDFSMGVENGDL
jgi:hypothetical protein